MLSVCEIFKSVQGEGGRAGMVCTFVRLSGCNLRCTYCDTPYARDGGEARSVEDILAQVRVFGCGLVEVTGGEPLLQEQTPALCEALIGEGHTVLVETNGSRDISVLPQACIRIVDIKCPGSGMADSFMNENLQHLTARDEVKMVVSSREDFAWAYAFVTNHDLTARCPVILSPAWGLIDPRELAEWILEAGEPLRLGLQLHKVVWGDVRGR